MVEVLVLVLLRLNVPVNNFRHVGMEPPLFVE